MSVATYVLRRLLDVECPFAVGVPRVEPGVSETVGKCDAEINIKQRDVGDVSPQPLKQLRINGEALRRVGRNRAGND